jgi:hypothetical protein
MTIAEDVRRLHAVIDGRIEVDRREHPARELSFGVVAAMEGDGRSCSVLLDGATRPTPYVTLPSLPVAPASGDRVAVERRRGGSLMVGWVLDRPHAWSSDIIDVEDPRFGAVPCVGGVYTDSSQAIQRAIDHAGSRGGGTVHGRGLYGIARTLRNTWSSVRLDLGLQAQGIGAPERGYAQAVLDGSAASGQKVVPVATTTGFSVGEQVFLGHTNATYEVGVIASISSGVSFTLAENLAHAHGSGDVVWKAWDPALYADVPINPLRTGLLWIGADGGTMVDFSPDMGSIYEAPLTGCGFRGSLYAGVNPFTSVAAVGLRLSGVQFGTFSVWGMEFSDAMLHLDGTTTGVPNQDISIAYCDFPQVGGIQLHRAGSIIRAEGGGVYRNVFGVIIGRYKDGNGIELGWCDNNLFQQTNLEYPLAYVDMPATHGAGVLLKSASVDYQVANLNVFDILVPGGGNVVEESGGTLPLTPYFNEIRRLDTDVALIDPDGRRVPPDVSALSSLRWRFAGGGGAAGYETYLYPVAFPAQITGDVTDWDPGIGGDPDIDGGHYISPPRDRVHFHSNGNHTVHGMVPAGDGREVTLVNIGSEDTTFASDSVSAVAGHAYRCPGDVDLVVRSHGSIKMFYNGTESVWQVEAP